MNSHQKNIEVKKIISTHPVSLYCYTSKSRLHRMNKMPIKSSNTELIKLIKNHSPTVITHYFYSDYNKFEFLSQLFDNTNGSAILWFSLEQTAKELTNQLQKPIVDTNQKVLLGQPIVIPTNLYIIDKTPISILEIAEICKNYSKQNPQNKVVIIIDFLQLIHTTSNTDDIHQQFEQISQKLKCSIIILSYQRKLS